VEALFYNTATVQTMRADGINVKHKIEVQWSIPYSKIMLIGELQLTAVMAACLCAIWFSTDIVL
jgi:hypothetical protein